MRPVGDRRPSPELEAERGTQSAGQLAVAEAEEQYWAMEQAAREAASAWEAAREAAIRAESRHDALVERDLDLGAEAERTQRALTELAESSGGADADSPSAVVAEASGPAAAAGTVTVAEARYRAAADQSRAASAGFLPPKKPWPPFGCARRIGWPMPVVGLNNPPLQRRVGSARTGSRVGRGEARGGRRRWGSRFVPMIRRRRS